MSWLVLFVICLGVFVVCSAIYLYAIVTDRINSHTKKELSLMSATNRAALTLGGLMVFSGVALLITPAGEPSLMSKLISSVCMSVGGALSGVGLHALFEIQDKRRYATSRDKLVIMTRADYREKFGFEDYI